MADDRGWPYPEQLGLPLNPHQSGWHWVRFNQHYAYKPVPYFWNGTAWAGEDIRNYSPERLVEACFEYLGPCLLPTEIDALIAAKVATAEQRATAAETESERLRERLLAFQWADLGSDRCLRACSIRARLLATPKPIE